MVFNEIINMCTDDYYSIMALAPNGDYQFVDENGYFYEEPKLRYSYCGQLREHLKEMNVPKDTFIVQVQQRLVITKLKR